MIRSIKLLFTALICCLSCSAFAVDLIELKPGANNIDINADGRMDYAFLAQYDNNKSHPSQTITFYIQKPGGGYSIMPSIVDNEFPYFSVSLSGSQVTVNGFALVQNKTGVYFATADKHIVSAYDAQKFDFTFYKLIETDDHPGIALYHWKKAAIATSAGKFRSADGAFKALKKQVIHFITSD